MKKIITLILCIPFMLGMLLSCSFEQSDNPVTGSLSIISSLFSQTTTAASKDSKPPQCTTKEFHYMKNFTESI